MDTGLDRVTRLDVASPAQPAALLDRRATPHCLAPGWALPPLQDYTPGTHSVRPASTRWLARHSKPAAGLAAGLLVWSALAILHPALPTPRLALAGGTGLCVLVILTVQGKLAGGAQRR